MQIVKLTNEHLHEADEQAATCQEVKLGMKRKASETQDSSHHIVGDGLITVSEGVYVKLPKLTSPIKHTIQRQRERGLAAQAQPLSLEELVLPLDYQQTAKGEHFLLFLTLPWTRENLHVRDNETSSYWNHLSTGLLILKTAPELFSQVYAIHALRGGPEPLQNGHLLPCLFVQLTNKTQDTYTRTW